MPDDTSNLDIQALRQEIELLRKDMDHQKTDLEGTIEVAKTGLEKDVDYLKKLVWALIGGVVSLIVGLVLRVLGWI